MSRAFANPYWQLPERNRNGAWLSPLLDESGFSRDPMDATFVFVAPIGLLRSAVTVLRLPLCAGCAVFLVMVRNHVVGERSCARV